MTHSPTQRRARPAAIALGVALLAGIAVLRFANAGNHEPLLLLTLVPVAILAMELGLLGGLAAGAVSYGEWLVYTGTTGSDAESPHLEADGIAMRAVLHLVPGVLIGWLADRGRSAERALARRERELRFIAEESGDMISTHAADGRYLFVSSRCRELVGYEPEELVGTMAYDHIHPADHDVVRRVHEATLAQAATTTATYRVHNRDGRYVWIETRSRARRDPHSGAVEEIHCTSRDVSERHLAVARETVRIEIARERIEGLLAAGAPAIVYQPIVELSSGRPIALEALARFAGGPPGERFAEAWEVGLGLELELAAIRRAIAALCELPPDVLLSVNASPATVRSRRLLQTLGDAAPRVIVEVTEHADIDDLEGFGRARARLRERGARLAIDDVGAGFSGLARVLDLEPDFLKLDLALTREIDRDERRRALACALIAFGRSARIEVVAEGVETRAEARTLRELGVRCGQGYHLGRPAGLAEAVPAACR